MSAAALEAQVDEAVRLHECGWSTTLEEACVVDLAELRPSCLASSSPTATPIGWASGPTLSGTIEALAVDVPAALKAIDEMGQPRIAVVSRVNWRWPISL